MGCVVPTQWVPVFSNMGEAAALHPDELVFGAMMEGFTAKCYDGLSFFNEAHKVGKRTVRADRNTTQYNQ